MRRQIIMTGKDARYVRVRRQGTEEDDREIILTGDNAEFVEVSDGNMTFEQAVNR